jgi:hypothetical protein
MVCSLLLLDQASAQAPFHKYKLANAKAFAIFTAPWLRG